MKVEEKGNTIIIKDIAESVEDFLIKITHSYHQFENHHLILDLTKKTDFQTQDIKIFKDIVKKHTKAKKSIIMVAPSVDFNKTPAKINVVPSVQEAYDIIEMEEIERDLGF